MRTTRAVATLAIIVMLLTVAIPSSNVMAVEAPPAPDPSKQFDIDAAGATFPFPLIDKWRVEYKKEYSNVNLNYQSIGSGGGVKQHIEKTVDFAASDAPMRPSERKLAQGTLHIPEAIGGVVIAYNLPEMAEKGLKLTGKNIADIYLGNIKKWNDPAIAENNPDVNLPDKEIVPARRSDGSGTTFVFTDYLARVSPEFEEKIGVGKSVPWNIGVAAAGNEGVSGIVKSTPYSLGYIELAYAFQTGMPYAFVQNADGTSFVEPSIDSISAASAGIADNLPAAHEDWSKVSLVNAPGKNSYPIASFTYLLVYEDIGKTVKSKEKAQAVIHLVYWMLTKGQEFSPSLLYVPLSDPVVEVGKQGIGRITYNGESLWEYTGKATKEYNIPQWIKDNARWWAEGKISDREYINALQWLIDQGILRI